MKVYELKGAKGEVLAKSTTPLKHSITLPSKKKTAIAKVTFPKPTGKSRQAHLRKMAEQYIINKKNAGATRRARAVKIVKLADGRKVFEKSVTKQTKRSMMNPRPKSKVSHAQSIKDKKAVLKIVEKLNVDRLNAHRKKQMEAAGKGDKFVPIPYNKPVNMHGYQGKYAPAPMPKRVVRVTNLPESATEKQVAFALKRSADYATKIKINSYKTKPDKAGKTQKKTFALVYTKSEHDAQALMKNRRQKMKVDGKKVALAAQALHKAGPSKKKIAAQKIVAADKKKKVAALRKKNQERHVENQKRAASRRNSRRHSKFEKTKILRDHKNHHVYAIKRNNAAKAPKAERPKMNAYKKLRAMVRISRK